MESEGESSGGEGDEVKLPPKPKPKPKGKKDPDHSCTINFVKNTPYKLLDHGVNPSKIWGEGKALDPSPVVPPSRASSTGTGNYLLFKGSDIVLTKGNKKHPITFLPEEEYVLTNKWVQFEDEMTGGDLVELGEETFLMWWENIQPPAVPKPKARAIPKKLPGTTKKKR